MKPGRRGASRAPSCGCVCSDDVGKPQAKQEAGGSGLPGSGGQVKQVLAALRPLCGATHRGRTGKRGGTETGCSEAWALSPWGVRTGSGCCWAVLYTGWGLKRHAQRRSSPWPPTGSASGNTRARGRHDAVLCPPTSPPPGQSEEREGGSPVARGPGPVSVEATGSHRPQDTAEAALVLAGSAGQSRSAQACPEPRPGGPGKVTFAPLRVATSLA